VTEFTVPKLIEISQDLPRKHVNAANALCALVGDHNAMKAMLIILAKEAENASRCNFVLQRLTVK
jgi:hypothetical protein